MKKSSVVAQVALLVFAIVALELSALAATINTHRTTRTKSKHRITENARARRRMSRLRRSRAVYAHRRGRRSRYARAIVPTSASIPVLSAMISLPAT